MSFRALEERWLQLYIGDEKYGFATAFLEFRTTKYMAFVTVTSPALCTHDFLFEIPHLL